MAKARHGRMFRDDRLATIGIGTLIVFIALVLVAAIAAAILLNTVGSLQQQSQVTGAEAREDVSGGIMVRDVTAYDAANDDDIDEIYITVSLATGSEPIRYSDVVIHFVTEISSTNYEYAGTLDAAPAVGEFGVFIIYSEDGETSGDAGTLSRLDTDKIEMNLQAGDQIGPGIRVTLKILVGSQPPTTEEFTTPDAFDDTYFSLV
jgi:flagellin FlaB